MTTVKEFYERWENAETSLINMTESPLLSISKLAENHLSELYEMKVTLDLRTKIKNITPLTKISGINTDCFGRVTFEQIEDFVKNYYNISGERHIIVNSGGVMCEERENDLEFFRQRGYLSKIRNLKR